MEIAFIDTDLRAICENTERAQQEYGEEIAYFLKKRLADMRAVLWIGDMPAGSPKEIFDESGAKYELRIKNNYKLILSCNHIRVPHLSDGSIDWKKVRNVQILSITDAANKKSDFRPNWASYPGDTIADVLDEQQISVDEFAHMMNLSSAHTRNLLKGNSEITEDIAKQLSSCLGTSQSFWLSREEQYREDLIYLQELKEAKWLDALPVKEMFKFGWINQIENQIKILLRIFWCLQR